MGCEESKDSSGSDNKENNTRKNTEKSSGKPPGTDESAKNKTSVNIKDDVAIRETTGEEPAKNLPTGEFGDGMLGISKETMDEMLKSLNEEGLWCDPDFPANDDSLFYSERTLEEALTWNRPKDIVSEPYVTVDGATKDDIKQGMLGDCWFLSSCAAVSRVNRFVKKILPMPHQPLFGEEYHGIVHFRFWRYGKWVDVYIDDRLPTVFSPPQLAFAHCTVENEFWVGLLEKAYAKLHGSYEAIEGGLTMDALVDLTGGLAERYDITQGDAQLFKHMHVAHRAGAFIACSIKGDWINSDEADENGLVAGHAYTITHATKVTQNNGKTERLVRIRNPWGNETEWKGAWSDGHSNWNNIGSATRDKMQLENKEDGEFWMAYEDFCTHFQEVTICTLGPDFDGDGVSDKAGHVEILGGEWIQGVSAGGCRNNLEMFATNPQFCLTLTEADDFDPLQDEPENAGKCSIVIALMQEHRRSKRHLGIKTLQIGFILYKTNQPEKKLPSDHFKYNYDSGSSGQYINYREKSERFLLQPGHYMIIPTTFNENDPGSFILRVFAEKKFTLTGPIK